MAIKSEAGIYKILEDRLRKTKDPLTCVDLFNDAAVRKHAVDANRVSDYLGHMWRRGLLQRWYAGDSTARARFAYTWKAAEETAPEKIEPLVVHRSATTRPNVTITEEDDRLVLDFHDYTITIRSKKL